MNDTLKTIAERYSCRSFTDEQPAGAILDAIARAGIQAPSGMNRQGWQVIIIKNRELIAEMDAEGLRILAQMEDKNMYNHIMAAGGKLFYNAGCMILIAITPSEPRGAELVDCGIVAQNIALAAASLGLGSLHCGLAGLAFAGERAQEFKERLQFPAGYECGMSILLGYARKTAPPHIPNPDKITVIT